MDTAREILIQANEAHSLYLQLCYDFWIQHSLFGWKWWLLIFIMTAPWYVWWQLVDKKRFLELCCHGVVTFCLVMALDASGVAHGYWYYPIRLTPKFPHILPVDTTVLPIIYMLIYQYFSSWKAFVRASFIMAAVLAFIAEPMVARGGYYELLTWKYYYSFPIYILLAVILKLLLQKIIAVQTKNEKAE